MPDHPIIVLPSAKRAARTTLTPRPPKIHFPSREKQGEKFGSKFQDLANYFERRSAELSASAQGQLPNEVIVLIIAGSVEKFYRTVSTIKGMSFLGEFDIEDMPEDDDFWIDHSGKTFDGRLFLIMTNQRAIDRLLALWKIWDRGERLPHGFGRFAKVFSQLKELRRWSTEDRLFETGIKDYWQEAASDNDDFNVPFEIELWFRNQPHERGRADNAVGQLIENMGGRVLSNFVLPEIRYHSMSVSLPSSGILQLVNQKDSKLLGESSIMFFRPSGQFTVPEFQDIETTSQEISPRHGVSVGEPVVALFDGLPMQQHGLLDGRLIIDDQDGYEQNYPASDRWHGTGMASIIIHGDLSTLQLPLPRPLYVRPIMRPDPQPWSSNRIERIPFGVNQIDLTHRAVRRLFETEGNVSPIAPNVKVINISIGDPDQSFIRGMSAWGRLLDWLSVKYDVLFCVSAGNQTEPIVLGIDRADLSKLVPLQIESEVIKSLHGNLRHRRILSPSDSINALTIGSWHYDYSSASNLPHRMDVIHSQPMPSPISRLGSGFRNSIKPEILFPGGRQLFREKLGNTHDKATLEVATTMLAPGIQVASPGSTPAQLNSTTYSRGTSNSCAFAARSAGFLYDQLLLLRDEPFGSRLTDDYFAVLLKALLVHRASWGEGYEHLKTILNQKMRKDKFDRLVSRFLGYGFSMPFETITATDFSAVMLGCGKLRHEGADEYQIPLPPSLSGVVGLRHLSITLAWNSPVHSHLRNYREAALWFEVENSELAPQRVGAEYHSVRNGTVQHEIFEGKKAIVISDGDTLKIKVNCRADAVETFDHFIKYGLVVTLEVAEELQVPIYEEISSRIRQAVAVRP